jgi:aminoglycoside phosphotransferase (APT) family kinase protein
MTVSASALLSNDDFVRTEVWPLLGEGEPPPVTRHEHRHGIVEYRFDGVRRVFAKPVEDADEARATFEIQRALWQHGFGEGSRYAVAEPIAYLAEQGILLVGAAAGEPLREVWTRDPRASEDGVREAARWLAALHSSPLRLGPADEPANRAFHLAQRIALSAARRPPFGSTLAKLADEVARRLPAGTATPPVQTHGRYHMQHVHVAPDRVTVIDLDRAAVADPAKDVGEFLHRLRADAMRRNVDRDAAERATAGFVEEYADAGGARLAALEFFWSYSILFTLVARVGRDDPDEKVRREVEFFAGEFEAVPERIAAFGGST